MSTSRSTLITPSSSIRTERPTHASSGTSSRQRNEIGGLAPRGGERESAPLIRFGPADGQKSSLGASFCRFDSFTAPRRHDSFEHEDGLREVVMKKRRLLAWTGGLAGVPLFAAAYRRLAGRAPKPKEERLYVRASVDPALV